MPYRHDLVEIKSPVMDQNGYLVADAFPTKVGVFKYVDKDGSIRREFRSAEEVFRPASLESLKHRPIVDEHPGQMTAENTAKLAKGHVGEQVERVGDHVKANLIVTDKAMIAKIMGRNGQAKRELSCGYTADTVEEPGVWNGEPYDAKQTNIVYNHLASVWKGRAGATAQIHLDAEDAMDPALLPDKGQEKRTGERRVPSSQKRKASEDSMTIKLKREAVKIGEYRQDAFEIQFEEDSEKAVGAIASRLDDANAQLRLVTDALHGEKSEHVKTKASKDQAEEDLKKKKDGPDPVELNRLAAARADVMGVAAHMKLTGVDERTDDEIKALVVQKHNPDLKMDGIDPLIIEGRYDSIVDRIRTENKNLQSLASLRQLTVPSPQDRQDGGEDPSPRERFLQDVAGMHELTAAQIKERWAKN